MTQVRSVLVIKPSSLGDVLHVFPALELLRSAYPECVFDFLINPEFAPLLDYAPVTIRRRILFPRKALGKFSTFFGAFFTLLRELRRERYDLVIDFQGLLRSAFFGVLTKHDRFAGFSEPTEKAAKFFYKEFAPVDPKRHAVVRNADLASLLMTGKTAAVPDFTPPENPTSAASELLKTLPEHFIVMAPGARWESKEFPPQLFAAVARKIFEQLPGMAIVLTGTKAESEAAAALRKEVAAGAPLLDLTGKTTLTELCEIMRKSEAAVTNDSGPMHIGALMKTRVFAFFGPTHPELTGPWGANHRVFRNEKLDCSGCLLRRCPKQKECQKLDAELIANEIISYLKTREGK